MNDRILPIGIQSFEKLIKNNCIYVDKTKYVYNLVHSVTPYFMSRPRRFGKSLLLSTLKAYWEGKKELFTGLAIERLEENNSNAWQAYPIFYFDFNRDGYQQKGNLEKMLDVMLKEWESLYDCDPADNTLAVRFQNLIRKAFEQTKKPCVILVDEYDKPMFDNIEDRELTDHNREVIKGFFTCLKSFDEYIRFVFITGITKFNKVSIFSDLNQMDDITFDNAYAGLCGITEEELKEYFVPEVSQMAEARGISVDDCFARLKKTYDGYCFSSDMLYIYNPYSLLKAFSKMKFGSYWFETGTPTFLLKSIKKMNFDVKNFSDEKIYITEKSISDYRADNEDPIPLLYQTGYLTIHQYNESEDYYTLGFPNDEVRYGFFDNLLKEYSDSFDFGSGKDVMSIKKLLDDGDVEGLENVIKALFAGIPYSTKDIVFEHYFQTILYVVFTLLGKYVVCELHTFTGRVDCVVETKQYVYLFEFKIDSSADEALKQIEEMKYALPYAADRRTIYKIGANFDSGTKMLNDWKVIT